jgi:hypothetical protein
MAKASQLCLPFDANWQAGKVARAGLWTKDHSWTCWSANPYALLTGERHSNATSMMERGSMATLAEARAFVVADDTFKTAAYLDHHTPIISLSIDILATLQLDDWPVANAQLGNITGRTSSLIFLRKPAIVSSPVRTLSRAIQLERRRHERSPAV